MPVRAMVRNQGDVSARTLLALASDPERFQQMLDSIATAQATADERLAVAVAAGAALQTRVAALTSAEAALVAREKSVTAAEAEVERRGAELDAQLAEAAELRAQLHLAVAGATSLGRDIAERLRERASGFSREVDELLADLLNRSEKVT